MDWEQLLKANGLDRYDRAARLYPAFLCLLPVFAVPALWLPRAWSLLGGLAALAAGCGLVFSMAQVVRYLGRRVEKKLGERVGRAHSAALLGHGDARIAPATKARCHKFLGEHGVKVPSRASEASNPEAARQGFRSAVDWLLEHTRPNAGASMLLNENISYGFRRNLLGLKPVAIALLVPALIGNAYLIAMHGDQTHAVAAGVVELFFVLALAAWLLVVRPDFVEDASLVYAQRLFAQCENAQTAKRPQEAQGQPQPGAATAEIPP